MSARSRTTFKVVLLSALYLSQGLPYGFFIQALPVFLRSEGVSLESIGLSSLLALPWALKFLWAPLIDRGGRRRRWILALQGLGALVLAGLAFIDPAAIPWLVAGVLLTNLIAATQDIATDGLAVLLLSHKERGLGNGIQVAGYRVGMIIGGGAILMVYDRLGWTLSFLVMAGLLALATLPLLLERAWLPAPAGDPKTSADEPAPGEGGESAWRDFLRRPGMPLWLILITTFKLGDYLAGGMLRTWLVDADFTKASIGALFGLGGFIPGLLGALVGGWGVGRLGRRRAMRDFALLQALGIASYGLVALIGPTEARVLVAVVFEHFVGGLATVALFTWMMDACRESHASSDYTLQASLVVIASIAASSASGFVAHRIGYAGTFLLGAALAGLWWVVIALLARDPDFGPPTDSVAGGVVDPPPVPRDDGVELA